MATLRFGAICVHKRKETPPLIFGGNFSKLYQVTSQTQFSRPTAFGRYTSWSTDSASNNNVCEVTAAADIFLWKHTLLRRVPRWLGE